MRDFLLKKETILCIESEEKRFFGKFASKEEKERYRKENPDINVLGKPKKKDDLWISKYLKYLDRNHS